jgi:hypothetical protein
MSKHMYNIDHAAHPGARRGGAYLRASYCHFRGVFGFDEDRRWGAAFAIIIQFRNLKSVGCIGFNHRLHTPA